MTRCTLTLKISTLPPHTGSAGPRTARNALEAGQELLGAVIPSGPGAETLAAQAEIDAQREAQGAPAVSSIYPDEAQRGIKPGPTAATAAKPGAGKTKPEGGVIRYNPEGSKNANTI